MAHQVGLVGDVGVVVKLLLLRRLHACIQREREGGREREREREG